MNVNKSSLMLFDEGNSCAQAILGAFAHKVNINFDTAIKIGSGLGGGIGSRQYICGAVNAGAIILGLKFSNGTSGDLESKEQVTKIVGKFIDECEKELGSVECWELLQTDLSNSDQKLTAKESGLFDRVCNNAVIQTARILEKYLDEEN